MNTIQEFIKLNNKIQTILHEKNIDWEFKYDMIFSENISRKVFSLLKELGTPLDYYDPDTSYAEDVIAFANAVEQKVKNLDQIKKIFD